MQEFFGGKSPYLECRLCVHGSKSPSLLIPCTQLPNFENPPSVSPPSPLPSSRHHIYLHADDINTPDSSFVGHTAVVAYSKISLEGQHVPIGPFKIKKSNAA